MTETINKQQFIDLIAEDNGITKTEAKRVVNMFINGVKTVMKKHAVLNLIGFAKFKSVFREATQRVFGVTGEVYDVPAHYEYRATVSKKIAD